MSSAASALLNGAYHWRSVCDVHLSADGRVLGTTYMAGSVWSGSYKSHTMHSNLKFLVTIYNYRPSPDRVLDTADLLRAKKWLAALRWEREKERKIHNVFVINPSHHKRHFHEHLKLDKRVFTIESVRMYVYYVQWHRATAKIRGFNRASDR